MAEDEERRGRPAKGRSRCALKNCNRQRHYPSYGCKKHRNNEEIVRLDQNPPAKRAKAEKVDLSIGFVSDPITVAGSLAYHRVKHEVMNYLNGLSRKNQRRRVTSCRNVYKLRTKGTQWVPRITRRMLDALLDDLLTLTRSVLSRCQGGLKPRLKRPRVHLPAIIVAPRLSSGSSAHAAVAAHTDFHGPYGEGVYTFLMFLHDIDESSGAIKMWNDSVGLDLSESKSRPRDIKARGLAEPSLLVGDAGTVYVFDGRLVHQSIGNASDRETVRLSWTVTAEEYGPVEYTTAVDD